MTTSIKWEMLKVVPLAGLILIAQLSPATFIYVPFVLFWLLCFVISRYHLAIFFRYCWPLIAIFLLGGVASLASGELNADTVKGAFYMSRPFIFMGVGIYLSTNVFDFQLFKRAVMISAFILSIVYIFRYLSDPAAGMASRYALREVDRSRFYHGCVRRGAHGDRYRLFASPIF